MKNGLSDNEGLALLEPLPLEDYGVAFQNKSVPAQGHVVYDEGGPAQA